MNSVLSFFPLPRYVSESIPWLVSTSRLDEAKRVIERASRQNNLSSVPEMQTTRSADCQMQTASKPRLSDEYYWEELSPYPRENVARCRNNMVELFRNARLRKHILIMSAAW